MTRVLGALVLSVALLGTPATAAERRTPVVEAVERATPSVVTIETEVAQASPFSMFYGPQRGSSAGSGVIIDSDGVVLTNAHVVEGALSIAVHTQDGRTWPAVVLAMESELDLAVLRLQGASGLPEIEMADSDALLLGEPAIAIGNPYGLGLTVSTGIVSSVRRDVEIRSGLYQSYIQTDAAINPGNSGGALVNIDGALIGINTAIRADAEGIGFAIPVNRARKIAEDMLAYGDVRAPWLGMAVSDIHPRRLAGTPLAKGAVLVSRVWSGGPAARAGLAPGDVLFRIDGRPVASRADLNAYLAARRPGAEVTLGILRDDRVLELRLTSTDLSAESSRAAVRDILGVAATPLRAGVRIDRLDPNGTFARAGLRPGDVVLAADGQALSGQGALEEAVRRARARHRGSLLLTVQRGQQRGMLEVGL